ncbi:ABC transporter substrate-binding protein [Selenomonas ruminantium]|nr:ABC transporter substrate-binding protein [Selenomonas ruminantium]
MSETERRNAIYSVLAALALVLVIVLAGCGSDTKKSAEKVDENEVYEFNFPNVPWSDPVYIAAEKGFFAKHGLKVNFTGYLANINDIVTNVASGNFPFACQHASTLAVGISNGYPIKAIAAGWGTSAEKPMLRFLTLKDSGINNLDDLRGHKIAIPTPTELEWLEAKDKLNFKDGDVDETVISYEKMDGALLSHQVDAVMLINPFSDRLLTNESVKQIGTLVDIVGEEKGWPQQFVNTAFLEKNPEIVKRYVAAIADANDWARANPDEAGLVIAKALNVDPSQGALYNPVFPEHALIDKSDADLWVRISGKYGLLARPVSLDELYTNQYNPYNKGGR